MQLKNKLKKLKKDLDDVKKERKKPSNVAAKTHINTRRKTEITNKNHRIRNE